MSTVSVSTVSSCSTIKSSGTTSVPAVQNSSGNENGFFIRAWAKFNGSGNVASSVVGGNISSAVDNGEGDYTINFSTNCDGSESYSQATGSDNGVNQIDNVDQLVWRNHTGLSARVSQLTPSWNAPNDGNYNQHT